MKKILIFLFVSLLTISFTGHPEHSISRNTSQHGSFYKHSENKEVAVYICLSPNAYAYHKNSGCRSLKRCKHKIVKVKLTDAVKKHFRPCKICYRN
jgi:hypothetical protein